MRVTFKYELMNTVDVTLVAFKCLIVILPGTILIKTDYFFFTNTQVCFPQVPL
jgi:hypothetical protein